MYIDYTFKVNAFSTEKGVVSVTFISLMPELELEPVHIQQLGVNRQDMVDYSKGVIDQAEFQTRMRKQIVDADDLPQERWNKILEGRELLVPAEVTQMLGREWPPVTEAESTGTDEYKVGVL